MSQPKKAGIFLSFRVRPIDLFTAFGAVLGTATVFGFFGQVWWFFDLFSHFRVQLFLGLTAAAVAVLLVRNYAAAAFFGAFAIINLSTIVPLYMGESPETGAASRGFRALLLNVNSETGSPAKVARLIEQEKPDIIALEEINDRWLSALGIVLTNYPHFKVAPRDDNFGIGLFSKYEFRKCEVRQLGEAELPSIVAETQMEGMSLCVMATHPLPPGGAENSQLRDEQLAQVSGIIKQSAQPVLLLGDLNATPWCASFKRLLEESSLHDATQGKGVLPTWPTYLPVFLIPIDHCLHTAGIHVRHVARGPAVGSDHYPLLIDFVVDSQRQN